MLSSSAIKRMSGLITGCSSLSNGHARTREESLERRDRQLTTVKYAGRERTVDAGRFENLQEMGIGACAP